MRNKKPAMKKEKVTRSYWKKEELVYDKNEYMRAETKGEFDEIMNDEYIKVESDTPCEVPLIQAAKVIGIEKDELPIIKTDAAYLEYNFQWLKKEREKGLLIYGVRINDTKDHLIKVYPKIKTKLKKQFSKEMNKAFKHHGVTGFVNSAVLLELDHMFNRLGERPPFLSEGRTLN
tara:strand:+ start:499 stop:1023 length:525 start_codon:yes stop_codon:yes gene_type:complete